MVHGHEALPEFDINSSISKAARKDTTCTPQVAFWEFVVRISVLEKEIQRDFW